MFDNHHGEIHLRIAGKTYLYKICNAPRQIEFQTFHKIRLSKGV